MSTEDTSSQNPPSAELKIAQARIAELERELGQLKVSRSIDDVLAIYSPLLAKLSVAEATEPLHAELREQVRANSMLIADRDHWKTCAQMEFEIRSEIEKENSNLKQGSVEAFMCTVEFDYELGHALSGNKLYPHAEDLKENHKCWQSCGISKVAVSLISEVVPAKY
jgi:hypothetical protein